MEDSRSVAAWLGTQELLLGKIALVEDVIGHIDAVTSEDVARVGQRVLNEENLKLAMVGPRRSDQALLKLLKF